MAPFDTTSPDVKPEHDRPPRLVAMRPNMDFLKLNLASNGVDELVVRQAGQSVNGVGNNLAGAQGNKVAGWSWLPSCIVCR